MEAVSDPKELKSFKASLPKIPSVLDMMDIGLEVGTSNYIMGPKYLDCLDNPWEKKQVLGLIAGTGLGKSTMALNILRDVLINNPDEIVVLVSLEMAATELIKKWKKLNKDSLDISNRFYILSSFDEVSGESKKLGIQEIHNFCQEIKIITGKKIANVVIDHIGLIDNHINITVEPNFGITRPYSKKDNLHPISQRVVCDNLKKIAIMLDTFLIVLSQTKKSLSCGYKPLFKDAAYGVSQFENICDFIIGIFQPLYLIQNTCDVKFTAFLYSKIRNASEDDMISVNQPLVLVHELKTGEFRAPTNAEMLVFMELIPEAEEANKDAEKNGFTVDYSAMNGNGITKLLDLLRNEDDLPEDEIEIG